MKQLLVFLFLLSFTQIFSQDQPDSLKKNSKVKIILENKNEKSGYLVYDSDEEVKIWSEKFGFLKIPKIQIKEIIYLKDDYFETKVEEDTSATDYIHHYAITNSAFAPKKGDIYIRTQYFVSATADYGVTNNFTIGLGAFYFAAVNLNLRYSFSFSEKSKLGLAVGSYYSYLGGGYSSSSSIFSARATYTYGTPVKNFSIGGTFITNFQRMETGIVQFSSLHKMSKKTYFISDISFAPSLRSISSDLNYIGIGFFGIRIKTKKGNRLDLGFANIFIETSYNTFNGTRIYENLYIPAPFIQLAYKL
jgi:hypothetical protein